MIVFRCLVLLLVYLANLCINAFAGNADVAGVVVQVNERAGYNFAVTVAHEDTGWEHYANRWESLDADGNTLGARILHHPNVNEQPFTRNLYGIAIPDHVTVVTVRAHDSVHGHGGKFVYVDLTGKPSWP